MNDVAAPAITLVQLARWSDGDLTVRHVPGPSPLRVVLVRLGIAEIGEHAISHVSRDDALSSGDNVCDAGVIGANDCP